MTALIDLAGQQFGEWLVLKKAPPRKPGAMTYWRCRCLGCETEHDVAGASLKNGTSTKCRACGSRSSGLKRSTCLDLIGRVFGEWTVVAQVEGAGVPYLIRCQNGHELVKHGNRLTSGLAKCCRRCVSLPVGTRRPQGDGYVKVKAPGHPNAVTKHSNESAWVLEHVMVLSDHLGRRIQTEEGENVHHKNGKKDDNRIQNLELWVSSQPVGQRPADLVAWAREIVERYGDEVEQGLV